MGAEAGCTVTFKRKSVIGKARLETDTLQFRGGDLKLTIPFSDITKVAGRAGRLSITFSAGTASFDLGVAAEKWAEKILHPPSRLLKIGVKPQWRASAIGIADLDFLKELESAVESLSVGRVLANSDVVFYGVSSVPELRRLEKLKTKLKPDGALWVVRPKGHPQITERAVMEAGRTAGLVDVKVVAFSATHTAEKFVIPVKDRQRRAIV
jgi:hypothetical protein